MFEVNSHHVCLDLLGKTKLCGMAKFLTLTISLVLGLYDGAYFGKLSWVYSALNQHYVDQHLIQKLVTILFH